MKELKNRMSHGGSEEPLAQLTLSVPESLGRAYNRCVWMLVNETGKTQLEIMAEMVRDFLVKHGC